jgi:hypothetical protein
MEPPPRRRGTRAEGTDPVMTLVDDAAPRDVAAVRAFETTFVLVLLTEYWLRAVPRWGQLAPAYYGHLALGTVLCAAALHVAWRRVALAGLAVGHAVLVWREFPATGNHAYLEVLLCLLGAFLVVDDPAERRLHVRAVRWMVVAIFTWSGVQKLVHGYWVHGQYLAYALDTAGFRPVLGLLLRPEELTRLAGYRGAVGDGPYLVESWRLLAVSNGTWLVEMALGPLLVWRRTRVAAAVAGLGLLVGIEVGAREVFFGLVFANAILTFLPPAAHRRAVVPAVLVLLALTLSRLGILPEATFY